MSRLLCSNLGRQDRYNHDLDLDLGDDPDTDTDDLDALFQHFSSCSPKYRLGSSLMDVSKTPIIAHQPPGGGSMLSLMTLVSWPLTYLGRQERYNHDLDKEDSDEDTQDDALFHSFSSCSPRLSKQYLNFKDVSHWGMRSNVPEIPYSYRVTVCVLFRKQSNNQTE